MSISHVVAIVAIFDER